eukprot:CAMPEP_0197926766 /NCGR_PEP_ID=MMETSP1439-20131203/99647_1 /TAXON_ID=66791 /ORGANISM="Gonyaulax spinifera, Strain CCMP409" /LENGTH=593 /DNA_ID=CAMNT_0043549313 /DNA_START=47 /DNA_END=1828 /DNA_ORIENTATION=+
MTSPGARMLAALLCSGHTALGVVLQSKHLRDIDDGTPGPWWKFLHPRNWGHTKIGPEFHPDFTPLGDGDGYGPILNQKKGNIPAGPLAELIHMSPDDMEQVNEGAAVKMCQEGYQAILDRGYWQHTWQKDQSCHQGAEHLIHYIRQHMDNAKVVAYCMRFLGASAAGVKTYQEEIMLKLHAAPLVVDALKRWKGDDWVAADIVLSIGDLTGNSYVAGSRFVNQGGMPELVDTYNQHTDNPEALGQIYDGMADLVTNEQAAIYLVNNSKAGVVERAHDHLKKYQDHGHMIAKVFDLMSALAKWPVFYKTVVHEGFMREAVRLLYDDKSVHNVLASCLLFIRNLLAESNEATRKQVVHLILNDGGLERFVDILKIDKIPEGAGEKTEPVELRILEVLYILQTYEPQVSQMLNSFGGLRPVVKLYGVEAWISEYSCVIQKLVAKSADGGQEACLEAECHQVCGGPAAYNIPMLKAKREVNVTKGLIRQSTDKKQSSLVWQDRIKQEAQSNVTTQEEAAKQEAQAQGDLADAEAELVVLGKKLEAQEAVVARLLEEQAKREEEATRLSATPPPPVMELPPFVPVEKWDFSWMKSIGH